MKNKILLFAVLTAFLSPVIISAQTPNLGTAGKFAIFTTTGAVQNTGMSQVTGDVGTNSGSTTGFGNVNGVMQGGNGATASAANDLQTAYVQISNTTSTGAHSPLLGNGDTLNAGVYDIAGQTTLNNTLTLNAQENPNAVFIFRISALFSSTALSKVVLINGAVACNVFWVVEGAINLGTLSVMKGNVIAHNGAIDLAPGIQLEGRILSTTGAISVNGVTAKTPIGCGSAVLTGPAAPNLGAAAAYELFSRNGEVTNTAGSLTNIIGDVGTNVGLTTGFDPLLVNGTIHPIPDNSTSAASADLLLARTYLDALAPDIELLYPAQFGHGLVLTPHTYVMNAGTSFNDTVFLNAEGNANGVFVIKIYGALSTGTYATVKLMNGAQAKNVYWLIAGAVTINDYSDFKGTMVCHNGAINLNTGVKLEGRALTTDGALHANAVTAQLPGSGSLPLSLIGFYGQFQNNDVVLNWRTVNEQNTSKFEIEQSTDGRNYLKIGTVGAAGLSNSDRSYSFTAMNIKALNSTTVYYRLKMIDVDGKFTNSAIVALQIKAKGNMMMLYPNPVKGNASLMILLTKKERITYSIIDNAGRILRSSQTELPAGSNTININVKALAVGLYTLSIQGFQTKERIQFVKQ